MNAFQEKRERRIERLRARAEAAATASDAALSKARTLGNMIPMGQPILVGHHSERRHRRDLARIDANMRKGVELGKEAEELARRADAAESNEAVSSDDPEAVRKLREDMAEANALADRWVRINAAWKLACSGAAGGADAVRGLELTDRERSALKHSVCGTGYMVRNARANARRIQKRIDELTKRAAAPAFESVEINGITVDEVDNRTRIHFPGKPAEHVRRELKSYGFKWAPSAGVWQRMASEQARFHAKRIATSVVVVIT